MSTALKPFLREMVAVTNCVRLYLTLKVTWLNYN